MKMYLKIHVKSKADELNAMWAVYYYLKIIVCAVHRF